MDSPGPFREVLIVGGGTSGWLAAGLLANTVGRSLGVRISLVEAPDIGIIGVGEATVPYIKDALKTLGISEEEFLWNVNGGFKQAICFRNWLDDPQEKTGYFYHPFHKPSRSDFVAAQQYLHYHPEAGPETFARLATSQATACELGRAPKNASGEKAYSYAYHMDTVLFGRFLRERFSPDPVTRIEGTVEQVVRANNGDIEAVVLGDGRKLKADLFIDCSGFRGLLINQALEEPFESFSEWLPCDRAVAVSAHYPEGGRMQPFTLATARSSGWIWDIHLRSRRGVGYVYSSAHQEPASAERELADYLGETLPRDAEMRHIPMRVGRNRCLWAHNCVAIGLAGGFIEPLESTGILLIQLGVEYLVENWPMGPDQSALRQNYNRLMIDEYDDILGFVFAHYVMSRRRDTNFWRDVTNLTGMPAALGTRMEAWRYKLPTATDVRALTGNVFGKESYTYLLVGMDWFRRTAHPMVTSTRDALEAHVMARYQTFLREAQALPYHEEHLAQLRQLYEGS